MHCVLDCSIAIAWCFEDEATPATDAVLDEVARRGAVVPALWPLEFANVLRSGLRKRRIDEVRLNAVLARLARLPFRVLDRPPAQPVRTAELLLQRCGRSGLTAYDQCYLDTATSEALPLATLDAALRAAAAADGVAVLPA